MITTFLGYLKDVKETDFSIHRILEASSFLFAVLIFILIFNHYLSFSILLSILSLKRISIHFKPIYSKLGNYLTYIGYNLHSIKSFIKIC